MNEKVLMMLFEDQDAVESFMEEQDDDLYLELLEEGEADGRFLFVDYKGEEGSEIVNFILDYEEKHNTELASEDELEELGDYEYDDFLDKIIKTNKCLLQKGYGLFILPSFSDFYVLFIASLANKKELLEVELIADETYPPDARRILYIVEAM
jgi:hypothetical protein